jgi:hypothetical protein
VTLQFIIINYVADANITCDEMTADKDRSVARQRILLGAHQRDSMCRDPLFDTIYAFLKQARLGQTIVLDLAVDVATLIAAASAQLAPQEHVGDAHLLQLPAERLTIELRIHAAVGLRSHVRNSGDSVIFQELNEVRRRMRRMPHRIDGRRHALPSARRFVMTAAASL